MDQNNCSREDNQHLFSSRIEMCRALTFLPVSTAEFISYLWSPRLPQEDLDEEGFFSVGRDHDLLDVRVCWALIAADRCRQQRNHGVTIIPLLHAEAELLRRRACRASPDGNVSVLWLTWLGAALQWRLSDGWHWFVHQHLLVLHPLTWASQNKSGQHPNASTIIDYLC